MDVNILSFLKYESGPTFKILNEVASIARYVDFFYPSKRILNSDFFGSRRFNAIRKLINEKDILFSKTVLDSVFVLRGFGATPKNLKELYNNGYRTIRRVAKLDSYEFNSITNSKTNSSYNRISDSITNYTKWKANNLEIITEILIVDYLQDSHETVNVNNLFIFIKKSASDSLLPFSEKQFYLTINDMQENLIVKTDLNGDTKLYTPSLKEVMSYDFLDNDVFISYLNNLSFREIAENKGVTRSRIQQVFARSLERLPILHEDKKYKALFERYNFNEENFIKIFKESREVYRYLNYKYSKGSENVIEYLKDYDYSNDIISGFLNEHGYYLNHNNEISKINILNIINSFMYKNKTKRLTYEEALEKVNPYLRKYGLEEYNPDDIRTFKARIDYSKNILASNDGRFRYYNSEALDKEQIGLLERCFDLPDGIYGSQKIFDLNIEIMKEFQLHNGEELLDLYNKLELDAPSVNRIIRRTEVQIGKNNKFQFIKEVLREFNGESLKDIIWYLSDEYGLHQGSINGYILNNFKHLLVNNRVEIAKPKTEISTIVIYLKKLLVKEIYLLREINSLLSEYFNESIAINNLILENTDYKVQSRHIIKKSFRSSLDAMKHVISKEAIFRAPNSQLAKDSVFYNAVNALLRNFDIFKVSDNTYINKNKILQGGIHKEDILDFIQSIENYHLSTKEYFTIKSILQDGFRHKLLNMGFESVFYEEILRNSSKLGVINTTPLIFYKDTKINNNLSDFIYFLIYTNVSIDYQDLINLLLNTYGLSYDGSSLREILTDTLSYYSHETEKFYKDKEQYYLEVYGK